MANRTEENRNFYGLYWRRFARYAEKMEHAFSIEFAKMLLRLPIDQTYYLKVRGYEKTDCQVVLQLALKRQPCHVAVGLHIKDKDVYDEIWARRDWIFEALGIALRNRGRASHVRHLYVQYDIADPTDAETERQAFHWMCEMALKLRLLVVKFAW